MASLIPNRISGAGYEHFNKSFDEAYGGFGDAPKFPTPVQLRFLFEYYGYAQQNKTLEDNAKHALGMAMFTLKVRLTQEIFHSSD